MPVSNVVCLIAINPVQLVLQTMQMINRISRINMIHKVHKEMRVQNDIKVHRISTFPVLVEMFILDSMKSNYLLKSIHQQMVIKIAW